MLYASGCRDIKSSLGSTYFKGEVHVTSKEELTKENIYARVSGDAQALPFTEDELLMKEEMAAAARLSSGKGERFMAIDVISPRLLIVCNVESGIGIIPFNFDASFDASLDRFKEGTLNVFEFLVASKEQVECGAFSSEDSGALTAETINLTEPRFYLLRHKQPDVSSGRVYFIFSCPEGT